MVYFRDLSNAYSKVSGFMIKQLWIYRPKIGWSLIIYLIIIMTILRCQVLINYRFTCLNACSKVSGFMIKQLWINRPKIV